MRSDLPGTFTDAHWAALQQTFPTGICDDSRPGIGAQPSVPWQTYAVGPGGRALGAPPVSVPFRSAAAAAPPPAGASALAPAVGTLPATGAGTALPLLAVGLLGLAVAGRRRLLA